MSEQDLPPLPVITGRVHKLGDQVNTDVIYPSRFLPMYEPSEMATAIFAGVDPEFASRFQRGDIIVAGSFFGCGSSREQAVLALAAAGAGAIVAKSFARIYFRNGINNGMWLLSCPDTDAIADGTTITLDIGAATLRDDTTGQTYPLRAIPPFLQAIVLQGGLVPHLRKKLGLQAPTQA